MGTTKQASAILELGNNYKFTAIIDKGTCNSSSLIEARIVDSVGSVIVSEQFSSSGISNLDISFNVPLSGTYFMQFERLGNSGGDVPRAGVAGVGG